MINRVASRMRAVHTTGGLASSAVSHTVAPPLSCASIALPSSLPHSIYHRSIHTSSILSNSSTYRVPRRPDMPRTIPWVSPPSFNSLFKQFAKLVHPDMFGGSDEQQKVNQESLQRLNAFIGTLKSRGEGISYPPKQQINLVFYLKKRRGDKEYLPYIVAQGRHLLDKSSAQHRKHVLQKSAPTLVGEKIVQKWRTQRRRERQDENPTEPIMEAKVPERGEIIDSEFYVLPVRLATNGTMCKHLLGKQFRSMFLRAGVEGGASEFVWDQDYWKYVPRDPNAPAKKEEKKQTDEQ